jgi:hypothetical protein
MRKWFDAFLYLANWGTHRFMCRVPADLIDIDYAKSCCAGDSATMKVAGASALFDFNSDDEDGGWEEDYIGSGYMASIAPIRGELINGDNRPLYLAWLLCAQTGELEEDDLEPVVPPGLKKLSTAQTAFADFLRLDDDLINAAATVSPPREKSPEGFEDWLLARPVSEKDALLLSLCNGTNPLAITRLRREFATSGAAATTDTVPRRTVRELLTAAETARTQREEREREVAAKARAKKAAAEAAARAAYLDELAGREEQTWKKIEAMVATKTPKNYDDSVKLLVDLRDAAGRGGSLDRFTQHVRRIMEQHAKKPSFLERIQKAGVLPRPKTSA